MQGDIIDRASELEQLHNEAHVAQAMRKAKPEQVPNPDGTWPQPDCEDCGDEIPLARLMACGSIRCIHCQTRKERGVGR